MGWTHGELTPPTVIMAFTCHLVKILAVCVAMTTTVNAVLWEIRTVTANQTRDDGTTNDINIIIFGAKRLSPDLELNHEDEHNKLGVTNRYSFNFTDIGEVKFVRVSLDGQDGWRVEDVILYNEETHLEYICPVNKFLDDHISVDVHCQEPINVGRK